MIQLDFYNLSLSYPQIAAPITPATRSQDANIYTTCQKKGWDRSRFYPHPEWCYKVLQYMTLWYYMLERCAICKVMKSCCCATLGVLSETTTARLKSFQQVINTWCY